jgi:Ca-activated chloride channel family protein
MSDTSRRNVIIAIIAIVIIAIILLLLTKCPAEQPEAPTGTTGAGTPGGSTSETTEAPAESGDEAGEALTAATIAAPERVPAGSEFALEWTGPDNEDDFVTIVLPDANDREYRTYAETRDGRSLVLTAPIEPGTYELRYVSGRSRTVLARRAIEVDPVAATLSAADEVIIGKEFSVEWTGPDNEGDYVTIVEPGTSDGDYGSYENTDQGSPVTLTAPTVAGDHELRYVSGQGRKVLARRPIRIMMADATLEAPDEAIAGTTISVSWTGPDNPGDYITVVASDVPDGQYRNYANTSEGSPLDLLMPIMDGAAEIRYMTGQGNRVLARRAIRIVAAVVTLSAPEEGAAGTEVSITWTGPDNPGDYITIVPAGTPDNEYRAYANTSAGSPLMIKLPDEPGDAEIRYVAGQGNDKVLARIPIRVVR